MHQKILKKLNCILKTFIKIIYPNRCISCKKIIEDEGFCIDCWKKLVFINSKRCKCCGKPLDTESFICGVCLDKKYYFDQNISVYNKTIARAIFEFKFKDKTFLSKKFADLMKNNINNFSYKIDYIVSVPMHLNRLRKRGYNQSFLLANDLANLTNIDFIKDLLIKTKNTSRQVGLNVKERKTNLKGSFSIKDKYKDIIKNKNILIIDDVFTTGSTINECAKILKLEGKVNKVMSLTIAKTDKK